jgi:hypothetical protein
LKNKTWEDVNEDEVEEDEGGDEKEEEEEEEEGDELFKFCEPDLAEIDD